MDDRCQFRTTKPEGAMKQPARGSNLTRYKRCRRPAKHTITIVETSLSWTREREVRCCGQHKRLHDERGWGP